MITIRMFKDAPAPSVKDQITANDELVDLTGAAVKFRMRPENSSTLKVDDTAVIEVATEGKVRYDWKAADVNEVNVFYGWWRVTFSGGGIQDTPEFRIIIDEHSPGDGVVTGAIAERARQALPIAYSALAKDERYGERLIQSRVDLVKHKLFATVSLASLEATFYDPLVQDYAGKLVALALIPAAVDYWTDQHTQVTTTGTNETVSYPDRIQALWKQHEKLLVEVSDLEDELDPEFGFKVRRARMPQISNGNNFRTTDPAEVEPTFATPGPYLYWSRWH